MLSSLSVAATALSLLSTTLAQGTTSVGTGTSVASLHSTNPTAVPLASITSNAATQPTVALSTTAAPGATAPISGAPPVPSFAFSPSLGYPTLDQVPDVSSPQVQQWIKEVAASGVQIPNIAKSVDGSCGSDPGRVANTSICWWTCGGCTRNTDITTCPDKMTWGLSYDDGPSPYSSDLLNYINANGLKSTFFIVGSRAISRPDILQAEYVSGHQLSVHTWSHPYLTTLSNEQIIAELGWTKYAIKQVTGVTPNTMRPPYGDIDDRVRAICKAMGLTPIMWSGNNGQYFDTDDWHIPAGFPVNQVINNFENILASAPSLNSGFIVLEHDLYQQTVDLAIGYVLPDALARKDLKLMSIIECLHKPLADAYIETNNNSTNPPGNGATTLSASATGGGSGSSGSKGSSGAGSGSSGSPQGAQATGSTGFRRLAILGSSPTVLAVSSVLGGLVGGVLLLL